MAEEFLSDRKRAMEEEFFRKREKALLEQMRTAQARQSARQALAEASGVKSDAVLDRLVALGIEADTLLALGLVPLVEVAWADGSLDARERDAVLAALESAGVKAGSPGRALIETWLAERPSSRMREAWATYTKALSEQLGAAERASLRAAVIGRARAVAEAAGGFLGLGSKVSAAEEEVLRELERAFSA